MHIFVADEHTLPMRHAPPRLTSMTGQSAALPMPSMLAPAYFSYLGDLEGN
jgi:hypothetical protein